MSSGRKTWSFFDAETGLLTGRTYRGDELAANTPEGQAAIEGVFDWLCQRVDIATGQVVEYQPPAPPDDALRTWAWDAGAKHWIPSPTAAALAIDVRAERDRRLAACDWVSLRAGDLGEPVPAAWQAYRAALRDVPRQAGFPRAVEWPVAPGG